MDRRTVLVVEDEPDVRSLFRVALALAGFDVQVAADGIDALRRIDSDPPAIVVLDLGLPSVSGMFIHEQLVAQQSTRNIPVVVVTGSPEKAAGLNAACVLTKPVGGERLVEAVRNCLAASTSEGR